MSRYLWLWLIFVDVGSHVGSFIISTDRLGVSSQCNFGSVRACACVYKGKWQYEVQLGSNGVMQVGWATLETKFSQEKGVGDTIDRWVLVSIVLQFKYFFIIPLIWTLALPMMEIASGNGTRAPPSTVKLGKQVISWARVSTWIQEV